MSVTAALQDLCWDLSRWVGLLLAWKGSGWNAHCWLGGGFFADGDWVDPLVTDDEEEDGKDHHVHFADSDGEMMNAWLCGLTAEVV